MLRSLAATAVALLALTGCSEAGTPATDAADETTSASPSPSESASSAPPSPSPSEQSASPVDAIEVEIEEDEVEPNGQRVEVGVGETIRVRVESDRAGELHVHSTPEKFLRFGKGSSLIEFNVTKPGIVDVEEHESGVVLLQLEVS